MPWTIAGPKNKYRPVADANSNNQKGPVRNLGWKGATPKICSFTQNKARQISDVSTAIHILISKQAAAKFKFGH
jgi:hypothetical protein